MRAEAGGGWRCDPDTSSLRLLARELIRLLPQPLQVIILPFAVFPKLLGSHVLLSFFTVGLQGHASFSVIRFRHVGIRVNRHIVRGIVLPSFFPLLLVLEEFLPSQAAKRSGGRPCRLLALLNPIKPGTDRVLAWSGRHGFSTRLPHLCCLLIAWNCRCARFAGPTHVLILFARGRPVVALQSLAIRISQSLLLLLRRLDNLQINLAIRIRDLIRSLLLFLQAHLRAHTLREHRGDLGEPLLAVCFEILLKLHEIFHELFVGLDFLSFWLRRPRLLFLLHNFYLAR